MLSYTKLHTKNTIINTLWFLNMFSITTSPIYVYKYLRSGRAIINISVYIWYSFIEFEIFANVSYVLSTNSFNIVAVLYVINFNVIFSFLYSCKFEYALQYSISSCLYSHCGKPSTTNEMIGSFIS